MRAQEPVQSTRLGAKTVVQTFPFQLLSPFAQESISSITLFDELDSTNTYLKAQAADGALHGSVIIAARQTAGRGRLGKSFYSPKDTGLYMSILYKQHNTTQQQLFSNPALFTTSAAVAVSRAIASSTGIQTRIKWVNDLYLNNRKICGILTEGVLCANALDSVVIGIGVNITTADFPQDIHQKAGALFSDTERMNDAGTATLASKAKPYCTKTIHSTEKVPDAPENVPFRLKLAAAILNKLFPILENNDTKTTMAEYKSLSFVLGKRIQIVSPQESYYAVATDITDTGFLSVTKDDGQTVLLNSGEISIQNFL